MSVRLIWIAVAALSGAAAIWAGEVAVSSPIPLRQWVAHPRDSWLLAHGDNPHIVQLVLPPVKPLSAMAQLGRKLFFDTSLSGSGQLSCASCHSPVHAYAPANDLSVQLGGNLHRPGVRAVPTLAYLYRQQNFSIGPDKAGDEDEPVNLLEVAELDEHAPRIQKSAHSTQAAAANPVPRGGLFWDGRVNTLQQQAGGPLFNPLEMDAGSPATVAAKLAHAPYAHDFIQLFGPGVFREPRLAMSEALFALSRYQSEDPSFRPFTSKYDAWLQGRARFTPTELRGYLAFNNPRQGNCAACHLDQPTRDGLPPLFTDMQYEALGAPRNSAIPANHDSHYFDMGLCGPYRPDLETQTQFCGMFLTPTLRNAATRHAFFHNGIYHSLAQVLNFYDFRATSPQTIYPIGADGKADKFNDIPAMQRANVDVTDPPFNRRPGDQPAMRAQDMRNIIAFLRTLNDGYTPVK